MPAEMEWRIGLEWFRNDTGKEFDGATLARGFDAQSLIEIVPEIALTLVKQAEAEPPQLAPARLALIKSGCWWLHVFHKPTIDVAPKTMFETNDEFTEKERSFDEIMTDVQTASSSIVAEDRYFDRHGNDLNGPPDFWELQAGLI
jgi:hypothetical protein